jgi:MazG family protein
MDKPNIQPLLDVMAELRKPDTGCPWDLEQTHQTLARYCLEEAHEVVEAIDQQNLPALCDELGDLLLQVVFHAQLASEAGHFTFQDVVDGIVQKMIRRHPHVFENQGSITTAQEVKIAWEQIKAKEKPASTNTLDELPKAIPALEKAQLIGKKVGKLGFDWAQAQDVEPKIKEEYQEYQAAKAQGNSDHQEEELGDLLFAIVQWIRKEGLHAERALGRANHKFMRRFAVLEKQVAEKGQTVEAMSPQELEEAWQKAKKHTRS